MNVCPELVPRPIHQPFFVVERRTRVARTVEIHERVECPVLGVVVVVVIVRPAEREGFEMSPIPQFRIAGDLGSPLVTRNRVSGNVQISSG